MDVSNKALALTLKANLSELEALLEQLRAVLVKINQWEPRIELVEPDPEERQA